MRTLIPVFAVLSVTAGARLTLLPYAYLADPLPVYYQSQDTRAGVHSYSYAGGPSAKEETRGPDGVTRGSYSYIDANGYLQSVFYVADEDGFRVAATNLPSNDGSLPYDTSEILLARAAGSAAREARNRDESPSPAGRGKRSLSDAPTPPSDDDGLLGEVSERPVCEEILRLLAAETSQERKMRPSASLGKRSLDVFAATNLPLNEFLLCKELTGLLLRQLAAQKEQKREESPSVSRRTYRLEATNPRYVSENTPEQTAGKPRLRQEQKFREDEQELREIEQRYGEQENMQPNWLENLRFYRAKRSLDAPGQDRQASPGDPSPRRDQPDQGPAIASKSSHEAPAPEETAGEGRVLVAPVYGLLDSVLIPGLIGTAAASQQSRVDVHSNIRLEAVQPAKAIVQPAKAIVQPAPAEPTVLLSDQVSPAGSQQQQQQLQVQNGLRVDVLRKDAIQSPPLVRLEPIPFVLPDYNENRIQLHKNLGLEGPDRKDAVKIDAARLAIVEETPVAAVAAVPVVKEAPLTIATAVSSQNRVQAHNSAKVEAEAPVGPTQYVAASYAQPIAALPIWPSVAPSSQTHQTRSSEKIEPAN